MKAVKKGLTDLCYGFFSTLANPTRLAIMERLSKRSMNVTQLSEVLGQEQSMVSHNLEKLIRCRFVNSKRKGKTIIYSLNKETASALFNTVKNHAEKHCPYKGKCPDSCSLA